MENNKLIKPFKAIGYTKANNWLAEMFYKVDDSKTGFILSKNDECRKLHELSFANNQNELAGNNEVSKIIIPFSPTDPLITSRCVQLPDAVGDYGSVRDLYQEIYNHTQKLMELDDKRFYAVSCVYVMMTWLYDRFNTLPYLRVIGEFGTGKSRFLSTFGNISFRPIMIGGTASYASMFRIMDKFRGTLIIDEADYSNSDMKSMIVKVLNEGHKSTGSVMRMRTLANNSMVPETFNVFGPKIIASRRPFTDDALESRCIVQRLFPKQNTKAPTHEWDDIDQINTRIRNKLLKFRFDHYFDTVADESTLEGIGMPRLKQTALALTSVAKIIGQDVLGEVVDYLKDYEIEFLNNQADSIERDVIYSIMHLKVINERTKVYMKDIAESFNENFYQQYKTREDKEYQKHGEVLISPGQVVSARKIGGIVKDLGLIKNQDGDGIHINLEVNAQRLNALVSRYGLIDAFNQMTEKVKNRKTDGMTYKR